MLIVSSAVVLNLSLLTSDFYAVVVAVFLFDQVCGCWCGCGCGCETGV